MLQALRGSADKRGREGGVVAFDNSVPGYHHAVGGAGFRQLPEMGHDIGHGEGRVRVQRDGRDLEFLIAEAGSVECLESTENQRREQEEQVRGFNMKVKTSGKDSKVGFFGGLHSSTSTHNSPGLVNKTQLYNPTKNSFNLETVKAD